MSTQSAFGSFPRKWTVGTPGASSRIASGQWQVMMPSTSRSTTAEIVGPELVRISLPDPRDLGENFVNSGVPHAIVPVDDLSAADVAGEGRRIRFSAEYAPEGTNVDFVAYDPPGRLSIRTYERGVEAETGACGTGSVAAALVGVAQHGLVFPVRVKTALGYELVVDGAWDGRAFSRVTLTGPVKRVFEGVVELP